MPSETTVTAPGDQRRQLRRRGRYAAQRIVRDITAIKRVAYCGRVLAGDESGRVQLRLVGVAGTPEARAGFANVQRCGSVWACPTCSEKVNAARQSELDAGIRGWIANGGAVVFGTATLRHNRGHKLAELWDAIGPAWNRTTSGAGVAWNGGKRERGDRARFGIAGYVRVVEVKHGAVNGWHPHVHFLLFLEAELPAEQLRDLEGRMFGRWLAALGKAGLSAVAGVGMVLKPVTDAAGLGDYFTKARDTSAGAAAFEVTGSQSKQLGKADSRTPFEILRAVADADEHKAARRLWREWEQASRGRRQLTWSRGLRQLLAGLADDFAEREASDQELVDDELEGRTVVDFTRDEWRWWHRRQAELLDAAENGRLDELLQHDEQLLWRLWKHRTGD